MAFSAPADFLSGEQPVLCLLAGGYASALNGQYAGNLGETEGENSLFCTKLRRFLCSLPCGLMAPPGLSAHLEDSGILRW